MRPIRRAKVRTKKRRLRSIRTSRRQFYAALLRAADALRPRWRILHALSPRLAADWATDGGRTLGQALVQGLREAVAFERGEISANVRERPVSGGERTP